MSSGSTPNTLFLDIGGVLLTNGWDHTMRRQAAQTFGLDFEEVDERHHLTYDTYEEGKLSLVEYLNRVIFYEQRPFSLEEFKSYMFAQSQPHQETLEYFRRLKNSRGLRTAAVSNEGRELTIYRIQEFDLHTVIDFFISSCFVHFRKPDTDIYKVALDVAQVSPGQVVYIDDRPMFVEVAEKLGIHGVVHESLETTREALDAMGLSVNED
ncbi:MAG: HAD family phosphatase [Anaerolineales bacterium]|jgi:putative hydrolase of the HAD superfamily